MDSQERDESRIRRRQESLARRVGEALDEMDVRNAGHCPDGEILAAYAEQGLGQAETEKWESHFATCARCRKILLVLATSEGTPLAEKEVAHLGELVSAARVPAEISSRAPGSVRPRRVDWSTRWLAPALGVAAVLAVWFALRPPWRPMNRSASGTLVAQAPKEEAPTPAAPAGTDRLSSAGPAQKQELESAPSQDRASAKASPPNPSEELQSSERENAARSRDEVSPGAADEFGSPEARKKLSRPSDASDFRAPMISPVRPPSPQMKTADEAAAPPEPVPPPQAGVGVAGPAATAAPSSTSQTVTVTEAAPLVETTNGTLGGKVRQEESANLPLNGRSYQPLATLRAAPEYSALLKAPSGASSWRAGKGGIIEHSSNGGTAWSSQKSPSQDDWLAGAAVSDTVAWLVGRNGSIARTVDGGTWERVAPPPQAAGIGGRLPDWIGVGANDARNAAITAGDGRRFATQDGGKSWRAQ